METKNVEPHKRISLFAQSIIGLGGMESPSGENGFQDRYARSARETVLHGSEEKIVRTSSESENHKRVTADSGHVAATSSNCDIIARQIDEIPIVTRLTSSVFADLLCQLDILFTHKSRGASSFVP